MEKHLRSLGFLAECGVMIQMISYDKYDVYGFYKSSKVTVDLTNKTISARYDEVDEIVDYYPLEKQLLDLNKDWWERSKDRSSLWSELSPSWTNVEKLIEERDNAKRI
jgi:hypothetical protein